MQICYTVVLHTTLYKLSFCNKISCISFRFWSIHVEERLALPTSDHGVAGSNPAGGEILPEPKRRFIAQSLSCSPFHRLEMTEILLKGRKTQTHPSIFQILGLANFTHGFPDYYPGGCGWRLKHFYCGQIFTLGPDIIMSPTEGPNDILFLVRILLASAFWLAVFGLASVWHFLVNTISHEPLGGF